MEQKYIFILLLIVTISLFVYNIYSVYYSTFNDFISLNNNKNFFTNDEKKGLVEIIEKYNNRIDNASKLDTYDNITALLDSNTIENELFVSNNNNISDNLDNFNNKMGSILEHSINEQFSNPPIKENLVLQSSIDPELLIETAFLKDVNCYILSTNGGCLSFKNNKLFVDKNSIGNPKNENLWLINNNNENVTISHKDNPKYKLCVYKAYNGLHSQTQLKLKNNPSNKEELFKILTTANYMLL
tara:strand:+ start:17757 stop:18485 length:729 start_codon:yes stop_codon:yes gene_type:complete